MSTSTPPESVATCHLPYTFDTRQHGRAAVYALIMVDILLLLIAVGVGLLTRSATLLFWLPVLLGLLAVALMAAGLFLFRVAGGAFGTVGRVHVTIEPDRLFGITTRTHRGTFPTTEFAAIRLDRIGASGTVGVLRIVGKNPRLQITLTVGPYETLHPVADFLCAELNLKKTGTSP